jgi:hypothetical protein
MKFKNFSCPRSFHAVFGGKLRDVAGTKLSHLSPKIGSPFHPTHLTHKMSADSMPELFGNITPVVFSRTFSECSSSIDSILVKYGGFFLDGCRESLTSE